jgi:SAM-dependent MidA family methyltransferase
MSQYRAEQHGNANTTAMALPEPDDAARASSLRLIEAIRAEIGANGGWIPFSRYMELALYAPGLGYYAGGSLKFGAAGDFVTAPEISPLFAQAVATQVAEIMARSAPAILEAGAGSGVLAAGMLLELERRGSLPDRYAILEVSGELAARQRRTLSERTPHLVERVTWLTSLPASWSGVVLGNELLDALPVEIVEWCANGPAVRGVELGPTGQLRWAARPPSGALRAAAEAIAVQPPYVSEIGMAARAWVGEWGRRLDRGVLLLLDYGFPRREYYHPQRDEGTLMCHYRRHAHGDPLWWPGLCDITAHVDFTAVAEAGFDAGLDVLGYATQANFLLNCGILEALRRTDPEDSLAYLPQARAVDKLTNVAEMGELFKVIALGRGVATPLAGFRRGDRLDAL